MGFDAVDRRYRAPKRAQLECLGCGSIDNVSMVSSMTCYRWDGSGDNPNAPFAACVHCAEEYRLQMQSQWDDYYSGLL
jgi:hypothetical protein